MVVNHIGKKCEMKNMSSAFEVKKNMSSALVVKKNLSSALERKMAPGADRSSSAGPPPELGGCSDLYKQQMTKLMKMR